MLPNISKKRQSSMARSPKYRNESTKNSSTLRNVVHSQGMSRGDSCDSSTKLDASQNQMNITGATSTRKRTPTNPYMRKKYIQQQELLRRIQEQESIENQIKQDRINAKNSQGYQNQRYLKKRVDLTLKMNHEQALKFQKKFAVRKAAQVIKLIERMVENDEIDKSVDTKNVQKKVLKNIIDKNKDKGKDDDFWSMQLLVQLGVVEKPADEDDDPNESFQPVELPPENDHQKEARIEKQRAKKLKDMGVDISTKKMNQLNKEINKMADKTKDQIQDEINQDALGPPKFPRKQMRQLQKLGLSYQEIQQLEPNSHKSPFKQFYASEGNFDDLLEFKKETYQKILSAWKQSYKQQRKLQQLAAKPKPSTPDDDEPDYDLAIEPADFNSWPRRKRLFYDQQKLENIYEWLSQGLNQNLPNNYGQEIFKSYDKKELHEFHAILQKMISSKKAQVFQIIMEKKYKFQESVDGAISDEGYGDEDESDETSLDSVNEEGRAHKKSKKKQKEPTTPVIEESGVVVDMFISIDSETAENFYLHDRGHPQKPSNMELLKKEFNKKVKQQRREDRKKKVEEQYKFLVKHGLTLEEAQQYTSLSTQVGFKDLSAEEKKLLDSNFQAQIYGTRKLRERLLFNDDPEKLKDLSKSSMVSPERARLIRIEQAREKIEYVGDDQKVKIAKSAQKEMTQAQLNLIRRREYYNRRVKADFAPTVSAENTLDPSKSQWNNHHSGFSEKLNIKKHPTPSRKGDLRSKSINSISNKLTMVNSDITQSVDDDTPAVRLPKIRHSIRPASKHIREALNLGPKSNNLTISIQDNDKVRNMRRISKR